MRPRWVHVRTGEPGYAVRELLSRGNIVGSLSIFNGRAYGYALGVRVTSGLCQRRAKRIVRRRVLADRGGLAMFISQQK